MSRLIQILDEELARIAIADLRGTEPSDERGWAELGQGLDPDEHAVAATMAPARRIDFTAGRVAMRALLPKQTAAILSDSRGRPCLPSGWMGSVSHKRGLGVAAVTVDDGWTIGVDIEAARPARVDLAPRILTSDEIAALRPLSPEERSVAVVRAFAIKEAVYKAIDPWVNRYVGFREVELFYDEGQVRVTAVDARLADLEVVARCRRWLDMWLCTARARRRLG